MKRSSNFLKVENPDERMYFLLIETLLVNFLFLLLPILIFLIFFENRPRYNKTFLILLSSISMVLCMTFPIKLEIGFIFDLRYIPFIIVGLFGGYKIVFPLYLVLNVYRFYIGGDGIFLSLFFSTVIFILVSILSTKFIKLNSRKRILYAALVSSFMMALYLSILSLFFPTLNSEFWKITFNTLTIQVGGTIIIMILVEQITNNMKTREKLMNSERLNVISELSASVSHEIRNPLTVTNGFLQLLNKSKSITQEEKRYVEYSLQELKRAEKIVSDYLALAKPQSENMVYSNLKDETEYVKNVILPYANMHQVKVQFSFKNSLHTRYDKNQIQQCLINLYKNGIEAMKENGGTLNIDVSEKKKKIILKIKDTGIGMTKEEVLRLGKPFYSTKEEGSGLGMLMVYSTINKVEGKIVVESEKGKGTTFHITIPVKNELKST
jgi:two-component system sporulation sensor kinase B